VNRNTTTRAALPPAGFEIPDRVSHDGLVVHSTSSDGTGTFRYDLRSLPGTETLRREVADAVARLSNEGGPWRSTETVRSSTATISNFLRWLGKLDHPPVSLAGFRRSHWDEWVMRCAPGKRAGGMPKVSTICSVLRASPHTPPETLQAVARRTGKAPGPVVTTISYTSEELGRIINAARGAVVDAERRITANLGLLVRYHHQRAGLGREDLVRGSALDAVFRAETLTSEQFRALGAWQNGQALPSGAVRELFMDSFEAWACAVLLAAENGWNGSVIKRMTVPDDAAGATDT
jgi:hypothetical protein